MRWGLLAVGISTYALGLIATLPATLLDARVQHESNGKLRISESQGTLWVGKGLLEIRDANQRSGIARRLEWRFLPHSLLRGNLQYEIALDQSSRRFLVTISFSRIELSETELSLPASILGLLVPQLAPLELSGNLLTHVKKLSFKQSEVLGDATVQWHAAGSTLTSITPLGDYELQIKGNGQTILATLRTLQGPLQLDGSGTTGTSNTGFLATAKVPVQYQQQLAPLLRLIAVEHGEGHFELQLRTP